MPADLILLFAAIGAMGGILAGLLGIGGGLVFVPALHDAFMRAGAGPDGAIRAAVATSLALVVITSIWSAFLHHRKGAVDRTILKKWAPFIVLGVAGGTGIAAHIDGASLKKIFACLALLIAAYMTLSGEPTEQDEKRARLSLGIERACVTLIGMIGATIGIGGAVMTIPLMAWMGTPLRRAIGTGSALAPIVAIPAVIGYIVSGLHHGHPLPFSLGYVNLLATAIIAPFCLAFAPIGVRLSHALPRPVLRKIFSALLVLVALRMLVSA